LKAFILGDIVLKKSGEGFKLFNSGIHRGSLT
jgi:hypothetical protein